MERLVGIKIRFKGSKNYIAKNSKPEMKYCNIIFIAWEWDFYSKKPFNRFSYFHNDLIFHSDGHVSMRETT